MANAWLFRDGPDAAWREAGGYQATLPAGTNAVLGEAGLLLDARRVRQFDENWQHALRVVNVLVDGCRQRGIQLA
jgi:hypothetical protein